MDRVAADSNIYISALRFGGKPQALLDIAVDGEIELAISDAILNELLGVLREKFHATPEELQEAERHITACTKRVTPTETLDAVRTDATDNRILECAVAAGSDTIVSGDMDLLRMGSFRDIKILKVSDFLARLQNRGRQ